MFFIDDSVRLQGKALYASIPFFKDEHVYTLKGPVSKVRTKYTIEIGKNKHITDNYGIYINHSSHPSVKIIGNNIIAVRDIMPGDEITFDYNDSETTICTPFIDMDTGLIVNGKMGKTKL